MVAVRKELDGRGKKMEAVQMALREIVIQNEATLRHEVFCVEVDERRGEIVPRIAACSSLEPECSRSNVLADHVHESTPAKERHRNSHLGRHPCLFGSEREERGDDQHHHADHLQHGSQNSTAYYE